MKQISFLLASILLAFVLTSCATTNAAESNDPYLRNGIGLSVYSANYVNRAVFFRLDDGVNGGGAPTAAKDGKPGTGGSMCCFNITDLKKPVKVELNWDAVAEPMKMGADGNYIRGKILIPEMQKIVTAKLPQRLPRIIPNDHINSEDVMCVVIRGLEKVELKYADEYDCRDK
ncbi:hypothetical protein LQR31_13725 [Chromobacterium vaccinii]|uniref:hypothetical protein n=1 Tax=Chromobacterium vaccinii TaxID=1108595 RepID=UPI001E3EC26D|nr:hypothetical protein [Chromobacterium vaccinii]MCD4485531.1 hypothetical protein [Chromobacterium vaccinii]